ncbi:hypothetical protein [Nitrosopumilus sp.]|uniref:hypothetical protein n=1 Tax=Nitrosopumilus sp. TaxID=2024843 RepID=UPI003B58CDC4
MSENDFDNLIYSLRRKIQNVKNDLDNLKEPATEIPELIQSTNALRQNEYLLKANEKKTELLDLYVQYSQSLEKLLLSVFEIQNELKEILKEQTSMISSQQHSKSKSKKISKSSKK